MYTVLRRFQEFRMYHEFVLPPQTLTRSSSIVIDGNLLILKTILRISSISAWRSFVSVHSAADTDSVCIVYTGLGEQTCIDSLEANKSRG